jgi:hypothetical protein
MSLYLLQSGARARGEMAAATVFAPRAGEGILLLKSRALTSPQIFTVFPRAGLTAMQESL